MNDVLNKIFVMVPRYFLVVLVCYSHFLAANPGTGVKTYKSATILELFLLNEKTKVIFSGEVADHVKKNTYQVKDHTGSISVEILPDVLGGLTLLRHDKIEIRGEVDDYISGKIILAHSLRKIK
jgi:uncharacterized protein (TIGR00156 family)